MKDNQDITVVRLGSQVSNIVPKEYFGNGRYVTYGDQDDYPNKLVSLFQQSSLHSSLLRSISQMISGEGLFGQSVDGSLSAITFATDSNGKAIEKVVRQAAFEIKLNGYCYLEVLKVAYNKIEVNCLPAVHVRNVQPKKGGTPTHFIYSNPTMGSQQFSTSRNKIPAFDGKESHSIMMLTIEDTTLNSYASPDYVGAINHIEMDISATKHKLASIKNGFFPSALVNVFNPALGIEKRSEFERKWTNKFVGEDGERIVFSFNSTPEMKTEIQTFEPANIVEFFKELTPEVIQSILVGHRATSPLLFGVRLDSGSGLGSNTDELKAAYSIFFETVVAPYQRILIEGFADIFKMVGFNQPLTIKAMKPSILNDEGEQVQSTTTQKNQVDYRKVVPIFAKAGIIEKLKEVGKTLDSYLAEGYELANEEEVKMAIESDPLLPSALDNSTYRIRYKYSGPRDSKNRTFCADVLDLDLIYRKEDIDQMSARGENDEFGIYNIFEYKGSFNCRHRWEKLIFKKLKSGSEKTQKSVPKVFGWIKGQVWDKASKPLFK